MEMLHFDRVIGDAIKFMDKHRAMHYNACLELPALDDSECVAKLHVYCVDFSIKVSWHDTFRISGWWHYPVRVRRRLERRIRHFNQQG